MPVTPSAVSYSVSHDGYNLDTHVKKQYLAHYVILLALPLGNKLCLASQIDNFVAF